MGKNITIYLAGVMEAYAGTNKAKEWRDEAKEFFSKYCEDVNVVSPVDYYAYGDNLHKTDNEIFRFDLFKVKQSDVLLVNLNDIRKSIGTCIEIYEAHKSGTPVIGFLSEELPIEDMIKLIHPWVYCCVDRIETGKDSIKSAMLYIRNYYQ